MFQVSELGKFLALGKSKWSVVESSVDSISAYIYIVIVKVGLESQRVLRFSIRFRKQQGVSSSFCTSYNMKKIALCSKKRVGIYMDNWERNH